MNFTSIIITTWGICLVSGLAKVPVITPIPQKPPAVQANTIVALMNKQREAAGLADLTENVTLDQVASIKACDMSKNNYFSHTDLQGRMSWHLFIEQGYRYVYAGENLARSYTDASQEIQAWMASPTHRENILSGNYTEVGESRCGIYDAVEFGER